MAPRDPHRAAILRRRAVFISSALTALSGCPGGNQPKEPEPQPTSVVPVEPPGTSSLPEPDGSAATVPSGPKLPPLDIPGGVTPRAKELYEQLAATIPGIHEQLDAADKRLSVACDITSSGCDDWAAIAKTLAEVRDQTDDLYPRCAGSSYDAKQVQSRINKHTDFIRRRIQALEERIDRKLDSDAEVKAWERTQRDNAIPRPCLKYACEDW